MGIAHFFNKSIVIQRLEADGFKQVMTSTGTIDAHIQRIDDIDLLKVYGVSEATHKAWVDISIKIWEGDTVRDSDGRIYDVVGVSVRGEGIAMNEHKELLLNLNSEYRGSP